MRRHKRLSFVSMMLLIGILLLDSRAYAQGSMTVTGCCKSANQATLEINIADNAEIDLIEVWCAEQENGKYQYVGEEEIDSGFYDDYYDYYYDDYDYNPADCVFTDSRKLSPYRNYYYQVKAFRISEKEEYDEEYDEYIEKEEKILVETVNVKVYVVGAGPSIKSGKRSGKNASKLSWSKVSGVDGYMIYCMTDIDKKGNMIYPDLNNKDKYTLVKQIKNNSTLNATFKKLKNGVTYTYIVYAYKNVDGVPVKSIASSYKSIPMDYYAYAGESYNQKVKRAFGSAKKKKKNFSSASKARKQMKTIKIKVWDYKKGKKGKKITKTKYLTVNKKLAPTIQQIFKEIYKSKEKQVIHDIGCYSYRTGEHMYGLAIDVNPNENYMIDGKKILSGKFWKPKKNPYSIPNNSEFVKIMNRYGFQRGNWGKRKDYMHFSYFGT